MTEDEIKKSDEEVSSALKEKFSFPMKRTAVQINRIFFLIFNNYKYNYAFGKLEL